MQRCKAQLDTVTVKDIVGLGGSVKFRNKSKELFDEGLHQDDGKQVFPSGASRSVTLQERYDLISPEAMRRRALTYGEGAQIHGDRNWEHGMPVSECVNRALRHLNLYVAGDTSEDHLAHASVNLDFVMHYETHHPDCVDVPQRSTPPLSLSPPSHNAINERLKRDYFTFLKKVKGLKEATIDGYAKHLYEFEEFTGFRLLDQRDVHAYRDYLTRIWDGAHIQSMVNKLKAFFTWLAGPGQSSYRKWADDGKASS